MSNSAMEPGLQIYLREIGETEPLTPEQETEVAERVQLGDVEARSMMIRANLRLVVEIVQSYPTGGVLLDVPLLDLLAEGNIALLKAIAAYDPARDGGFRTYAAPLIHQAISRVAKLEEGTRI